MEEAINPQLWWVIVTAAGLAIGIIGFFIKRLVNTTDEHGEAIQKIEKTYVTQNDFKEYRDQSRDDIKQLTADVNELKEKCLFKEDFFRSQADMLQRLDKLYDLVYQNSIGGGTKHGG